jgi:integrase
VSIKRQPDGRYQWRHRVDGKHLKKTFATRREAVEHDAKIKADLARGTHVDMGNRTTVAECFAAWIEDRDLRPRTVVFYRSFLKVHLEPTPLGAMPVCKVRAPHVARWVKAQTGAPYTRSMHLGLLRSMFTTAVELELTGRNPVGRQSRKLQPKPDSAEFVPLTVGQVLAWSAAAEPRVRAVILAQAMLGCRIGELLSLRVADVDFLRREVSIHQQLTPDGSGRTPRKNNKPYKVPLSPECAEVLAEHIRAFPPAEDGTIFTGRPPYDGPLPRPHRPYVPGGPGRPWVYRTLWSKLAAAAAAAGLPAGTSSHDLRHHFVSVLLDAGLPVQEVAARVGDTVETVTRTYGHLMPEREDRTRQALSAAWRAAGERKAGTGS